MEIIRRNRTVVILGRGPSHTDYMTENIQCETWASQSTYDELPLRDRINKVFRLHPEELDRPDNICGTIVTFSAIPINKLRSMFGDLFHSSAAWMVGTAIVTGYRTIHLIGIDLFNKEERGIQRDGLFRMMGMAESKGIDFKIGIHSGMYLHRQLYGLQDFVQEFNIKAMEIKDGDGDG